MFQTFIPVAAAQNNQDSVSLACNTVSVFQRKYNAAATLCRLGWVGVF